MPTSVFSDSVKSAFDEAAKQASADEVHHIKVTIDQHEVEIQTPYPSPEDWRDQWIYFLMVDRFNNPNPAAPPKHQPFDGEHNAFQGGTLEGVRQQLGYIKDLGAGAIWLTPVLKNCQFEETTFHGYGIQDSLTVEPRFASDLAAAKANPELAEKELRRLVDEAHARGLYVIFDIVLNHTGNVFGYDLDENHNNEASAAFRNQPYNIRWHDEHGGPGLADISHAPQNLSGDAAIWPRELQSNDFFRRKGKGGEGGGDFESLKEFVTGGARVREILIRAYQYAIGKFDVDGFRIDTLKFIERDFARIFGNAMREYALSIGKKNFFTFGEVFDNDEKIAEFVGRDAGAVEDPVGVDAALDFPLFFQLPQVLKGTPQHPPSNIAGMFQHRRDVQRGLLSSHGDASSYFVTFLDNHDMTNRFYFSDRGNPHRFDDQLTMGVACLYSLIGIPCIYYGTEQGLHGLGGSDSAVREALWGKPGDPFDRQHPFYKAIAQIAKVRAKQPALRYGRQFFRPLSGDGVHFGISPFDGGVLAFSRILDNQEVLVVANTNASEPFSGEVIIDSALNGNNDKIDLLFSNNAQPQPPGRASTKAGSSVEIREANGAITNGPARVVRVSLRPMEVQLLRKAS
jgi:glycosidase